MKWSFAVFIGDPASHSFFRPGQGRMPTGEAEAQGLVDRVVSELRSSHRGFDVEGGVGYTRVGDRFTFDAHLFGTVDAEGRDDAWKIVTQRVAPAIEVDDRQATYHVWPSR